MAEFNSENIDSSNSSSNNVVTFVCFSCNEKISASFIEIGKNKKCPICDAKNKVPMPRVKVGGKNNSGRRVKGQPDIEQETDDDKSDNDHNIENEKNEAKNSNLFSPILLVVLFSISIGIGWTGIEWGQKLFTNGVITLDKVSSGSPKIELAHIRDLVLYWKATRRANETIETDLKVSLAEMEARGMAEQANIVRLAIKKKKQKIVESKNKFSIVMMDIAKLHDIQPKQIKNLFAVYINDESMSRDHMAKQFLQETEKTLIGKPMDKNSLINYFGSYFDNALMM